MSSTLSYGFKKPSTGDRGSEWFKDLEDDIVQLNNHTHDGTFGNSSQINAINIVATKESLLPAGWVDLGGGKYVQEKSLPNDNLYDDVTFYFRNALGNKEKIELDVSIGSDSKKYKVYSNDNTLSAVAFIICGTQKILGT